MQTNEYLDVKGVARKFGLTVRQVYELVNNADKLGFPVTRFGGLLRFRVDRLEAWEAAQTVQESGKTRLRAVS